jgi:uncharacterized membrane protein YfcA|mmetsp:Transcript_49343/g.78065  ORF Transcript_49343/g.78065 Transcript_49343/m.78065 type:complete len:457 (+) Transcript_49343:63-1433(+)
MTDWAILYDQQPAGAFVYDSGMDTPDTAELTHPFWVFVWADVMHPEVAFCGIALFFSGILCSAAGIGGGGIYVAVLMVTGKLTPHNAVPLSKAIVFFGSIASLFVNMYKALGSGGTSAPKSVIDTDACRLVVPATLIGTFLGVLLNRHTSDYLIVILLTALLGFMTGMVVQTARKQALDESGLSADGGIGSADEHTPLLSASSQDPGPSSVMPASPTKGRPSSADAVLGFGLLLVVVIGGVLRFHMHACRAEVLGDLSKVGACNHPVNLLFHHHMELWMHEPVTSMVLQQLVWSIPIWSCVGITVYYGFLANRDVGWEARRVVLYQAVAVITGLLAGLVGVGGGLIFSPFFLLTGMDPAIAVGTSATCVLFTSSSTTLQYIFTDRIMMSLAVVYGIVCLVASFLGTYLVHYIQDRFARKSFITTIVALGVGLSAVLSVMKFCYLVSAATEQATVPA